MEPYIEQNGIISEHIKEFQRKAASESVEVIKAGITSKIVSYQKNIT